MKKLIIFSLILFSAIITSCSIPIEIISKNESKGEVVENNTLKVDADIVVMQGQYFVKKINVDGTECIVLIKNSNNPILTCNWK